MWASRLDRRRQRPVPILHRVSGLHGERSADLRDLPALAGALSRGLEHGEDRSTILTACFRAARSRSSPQRPRGTSAAIRVLLIDEADAMEVTAEAHPS